MSRWIHRFVIVLVFVHGLIHLLGAFKGFGLASLAPLRSPITISGGVLWLAAALLTIGAAVMLGLRSRHWWAGMAVAAVVSQAAVLTAWQDAKAATLPNCIMVLAAVYGFLVHGPTSDEAQWGRRARSLPAVEVTPGGVVTESDLQHLPGPLAEYVRASGAVGRPRVASFYAVIHGRIRGGSDKPWMPFTGKQINTFGRSPRRLFLMHAVMFGLPVTVLHVFDEQATMRARLLGLIPVVRAGGREMKRAETVTVFNDLVVLAPAAIPDAPATWVPVDDHHVRGSFTSAAETVSATLTFDDDHRLVDFVSEDRLRASPDGRSFARQGWSTPIVEYARVGGRTVAVHGEARWHAPGHEGTFTYLEFGVDGISYGPDPADLDGSVESAIQEYRSLATSPRT